jgi:hypothetical protein
MLHFQLIFLIKWYFPTHIKLFSLFSFHCQSHFTFLIHSSFIFANLPLFYIFLPLYSSYFTIHQFPTKVHLFFLAILILCYAFLDVDSISIVLHFQDFVSIDYSIDDYLQVLFEFSTFLV